MVDRLLLQIHVGAHPQPRRLCFALCQRRFARCQLTAALFQLRMQPRIRLAELVALRAQVGQWLTGLEQSQPHRQDAVFLNYIVDASLVGLVGLVVLVMFLFCLFG